MYEDYPEELFPETNTEADVQAYYINRNDSGIFDQLTPEQIQAIVETWTRLDRNNQFTGPIAEAINLRDSMQDTAARIIDGTMTRDDLDNDRDQKARDLTLAYIQMTVGNLATCILAAHQRDSK